MFRQMLFVACSVLLMQSILGHTIDYRCGANGCLNGAECQSNGQCKCTGAHKYGTYCDDSQACTTPASCTATSITNAGAPDNKCYASSAAKCICKDGYTGDTCNLKILDVTCSTTAFSFTINPHRYSDLSDFSGTIYFAHDPSTFDDLSTIVHANCKKTSSFTMNAFASAPADCGTAPVVVPNGKKFYAYIKHNQKIKSVEDQVIEVICDPDNTQKSVSITHTIVESSVNEVQQTTVSKVDDVTMKIRKDAGANLHDFQVHDTVNVNDNIALTLESTSDFMVKSCVVTDGEKTPATILVINDWCVDKAGLLLYSSKIVAIDKGTSTQTNHGLTAGNNAVKLPLKAVKFTTGSKMMFKCELCMDTTCKATHTTPCTKNLHIGEDFKTYQQKMKNDIVAVARKRRSVTNGTVGTSISVSISVDEYKELLQEANESKETECFKSAVVLLPLILLASLLVIAMGMTFFFCNKFTQNMTEGQSNIGFKA